MPILVAGILALLAAAAAIGAPPIVLDGSFADWRGVPIAATDPLDAADAEVDFGEVRVASDGRYVNLFAYVGHEVNVQRLDGRMLLLLDADGDPGTGRSMHGLDGVDAAVVFSPPSRQANRPGMGVGVRVFGGADRGGDGDELSPYAIGFTFAPTYANRQIEMRLERGSLVPGVRRFLTAASFSGKFALLDKSGRVLDETPVFTHALEAAGTAVAAPPGPDPFTRPRGTDLRVMSWNARFGALIEQEDAARAVIRAIDPDIILVQELTDANTAEEVVRVAGGRGWTALVGAGGDNLRSAVASRLHLARRPDIEPIAYPFWAGRYIRTAGVEIDADGKRILVLSAHLKCCGRIGDRSDEKRETEASGIRAALLAAMQPEPVDGVIIAGDLNLVGGRRPLEILREGLDVNGSDLRAAEPMQPDGRSNQTWRDPEEPFVPGRLDYVLYSDSTLEVMQAAILDPSDLDPSTLAQRGLAAETIFAVSDHLPVVVDLRWRSGDPRARAGAEDE